MKGRVAFIGNSHMDNLFAAWERTFPNNVTSVDVRYFGHRGANLNGDRFQQQYLPAIINFQPHRAFIWIGGNDLCQIRRDRPFVYNR